MDRPIKVAQVLGYMNGGGIEAVTMNYFEHINRDKVHFDFIMCEDSTHIPREEIGQLGGKVIEVPPYKKLPVYIASLRRAMRDGGYDIVHVNMNTMSVFALYAAWREGIPVRISHCHSMYSLAEGKRALLKLALRPFSKMFATDYLSCGRMAGEWQFGSKLMNSGRVNMLPNAIDAEAFKYDPAMREKVRASLVLGDAFVVGHVGRFAGQKNHMFLLELFHELNKLEPDSILMLVGEGPLMDNVIERTAELGISDSVRFLGQRTDVANLYQAMDVFVLPSLYEGIPVVGVEAQTAGLPCFFSDEVSNEVVFSGSVSRIPLDAGAEYWAKQVLAAKGSGRTDGSKLTIDNGFDIRGRAGELGQFYERIIKSHA